MTSSAVINDIYERQILHKIIFALSDTNFGEPQNPTIAIYFLEGSI